MSGDMENNVAASHKRKCLRKRREYVVKEKKRKEERESVEVDVCWTMF
jgi:hypothetical protein